MKKIITFSQAVAGYELYFQARHLSPNTFADYSNTFRKFTHFLNSDPPVTTITSKDIEAFLADQDEVSNKTLLNYHVGLSALWTWLVNEGIAPLHIVHKVQRPRPEKRDIQPYTEVDIRAMLGAIERSNSYKTAHKDEVTKALQHVERNRAILLILLDTGLRASELCELRIHQVDLRNRHLVVMGKGSKERMIPFCARTGQAIWRYVSTRPEDPIDDYLILTEAGTGLDRHDLRKTIGRIGNRAGVQRVNVHRFRHTFAINFLRNGGEPYSLQRLLGHSTMEMVKTYLSIAQADLDRNHRRASPVDNWRL
jgi:integrase/recombinase XerD